MTELGFIEIIIPLADDYEIANRLEVEDELDRVLEGLGEVSGGGAGSGVAIIDVDVFDVRKNLGVVSIIRQALSKFRLPESTLIKYE